jgi:hypothetical protein
MRGPGAAAYAGPMNERRVKSRALSLLLRALSLETIAVIVLLLLTYWLMAV